ncbi:MAG: hypothetical protein ACRDYV_04440 [Acidimicrobiia bacterium]
MDKSFDEARALAEAARLQEVVARLRCLAAATVLAVEANLPAPSLQPPAPTERDG